MRTIVISLIIIFVPLEIMAQIFTDVSPKYRVKYEYSYKNDSTLNFYIKEDYTLDVCSSKSLYYSGDFMRRDSVMYSLLKQKVNAYEVMEKIKPYPFGLPWSVVKDYSGSLFTYYNRLIFLGVSSKERLLLPLWKIGSDTASINGHICKKATSFLYGRLWTAWFATDININDGPWLLWGLPGLIMRAYDSNKYFIFTVTAIERLKSPYDFSFYYNKLEKQKVMTYRESQAIEKMYYSDMEKFESIYLGAKRPPGEKSPARKFIPLCK